MKLDTNSEVAEARVDLVPMIDTVMFLLIFFMLTTTLRQKENDLGIVLPGSLEQSGPVEMPDEQVVEVDANGTVVLNGKVFLGKEMPELISTLSRYRIASESAKIKHMITVQADSNAQYDRVIDVLNACAAASITNVTFSPGT